MSAEVFWFPRSSDKPAGTQIGDWTIGETVQTLGGETGRIINVEPADYVTFLTLEIDGLSEPVCVYDDEVCQYFERVDIEKIHELFTSKYTVVR